MQCFCCALWARSRGGRISQCYAPLRVLALGYDCHALLALAARGLTKALFIKLKCIIP